MKKEDMGRIKIVKVLCQNNLYIKRYEQLNFIVRFLICIKFS